MKLLSQILISDPYNERPIYEKNNPVDRSFRKETYILFRSSNSIFKASIEINEYRSNRCELCKDKCLWDEADKKKQEAV